MSADNVSARRYASNLVQYNDRLGDVLTEWTWVLRPSERAQFEALSGRIKAYQAFTRDMVLHADDYALKLTFGSGDADSEDTMRQALNQDLETFAQLYSHRAQFAFAEIERGVERTLVTMTMLGSLAALLALFGAWMIGRTVTRPLAAITRVTEQVAEGDTVAIPYGSRSDEIGALSRSITVFQQAMCRNVDLNRSVIEASDARAKRQERVASEIVNFSSNVEASIADLGVICQNMLAASSRLAQAADHAGQRTAGATAASVEASGNVRDIAAAADELTVSVLEIDRQVTQSNAVASKAVGEAERTNAAVKELEFAVRELGLRGLNLQCFELKLAINDKKMYPLYAKCIELDIPVNIHTGINFSTASQMDYGRPAYLDEVMQHFPELRVCASPPGWPWVEELIGVAWRHANVHIGIVAVRPKLIGMEDAGYRPLLSYGTKVLKDRILTGTSYPMQPLEQAYAEFDALPLPDDVRRKWMFENAARFLGL